MGACVSRENKNRKPASSTGACDPSLFGEPRDFSFTYETRIVSTTVTKHASLEDFHSFLLAAFNIDDSALVVSGVLVTPTGPLVPFFMVPYLHSNTSTNPYPIITAPGKDLAIKNSGFPPDELGHTDATVNWTDIESLISTDDDTTLYSSPIAAELASRLFHLLRRYGYIRLHLPATSSVPGIVQSAATTAGRFFASTSEAEKRQNFLEFPNHKFVGYGHLQGSARQFIQLRTTKGKITQTNKPVPMFPIELTQAYLALERIAYALFKLLCHPSLTPETHLAPELYTSLLDAPCRDVDSLNECASVPSYQFVGTNVFRLYQYLRHDETTLPGRLGAATSVHTDMGLLTVSPQSNLPGLTMLKHSDATRWVNVEMEPGIDVEKEYVFVFAGETMAQLTQGYVLAPLHFVDERTPSKPRFSMPFFLRARQNFVLPAVEGFCDEMTVEHFMTKVLHQQKQVWGHRSTTDF